MYLGTLGTVVEGSHVEEIRVVLADDHPLIRQGICSSVSQEPDLVVVGEASNGKAAVEQCETKKPDVLVLDIGMPGPKPARVVTSVREKSPDTRVLMLSAYDDDAFVRQLMRVGISGYLLKDEGTENVVRAIRSIHEGGTWFSQAIAEKFVRWQFGRPQPESYELTAREEEVMTLISRGWDNGQIATELGLAEQTIRNYASSAYEKIGVSSRAQAVIWARENLEPQS